MKKLPLIASLALFLLLWLGLNGCAAVSPWQRGNLAKSQMAIDPHPMQSALRAHNYGAREAASGVSSSEGGGCGCY